MLGPRPTALSPTLYVDSIWVYNGVHGLMDIGIWTPCHGLWVEVLRLTSENPRAVVRKTKAHLTVGAVRGNPEAAYQRFGNAEADRLAKSVLSSNVALQLHVQRCQRTEKVARQLLIYYGRLLGWAAERGFLPPKPSAKVGPRIPKLLLNRHYICESPCGQSRCVYCLRVSSSCRSKCTGAGDVPHTLWLIPSQLVFCMSCGAYSKVRTFNLHGTCRRRCSNTVVAWRRDRMSRGLEPLTGQFLGLPVAWSDPAQSMAVYLEDLPPG